MIDNRFLNLSYNYLRLAPYTLLFLFSSESPAFRVGMEPTELDLTGMSPHTTKY